MPVNGRAKPSAVDPMAARRIFYRRFQARRFFGLDVEIGLLEYMEKFCVNCPLSLAY